jgi:hypothetical protein
VVLVDAEPVLYLDRKGRRLRTFDAVADEAIERALPALRDIAARHPRRMLSLEEVDGEPAYRSPLLDALESAGFTADYRSVRVPGR